jgi:hypothetical protein
VLRLGDVVQRGEHLSDRQRRGVVVWADGECAIEQRLHPGHRYVVQLVAHGVIHTSNEGGEWTVVPDELVTHTERIMSLLHTWSPPPWADDPDDATDAHSFEWDGLAAMLTVEDREEFEEGDWPSNYELLLRVAQRVDALEAGNPERRSLLERAALRLVEAVDADVQVGLVNARSTTGDAALDLAEFLGHQMGSTPIDAERRRMAAMSVPIIPVAGERVQPGDRLIVPGMELEVLRIGSRPGEVYLGSPHNGLMDLAGKMVWIRRPGT